MTLLASVALLSSWLQFLVWDWRILFWLLSVGCCPYNVE